MSKNEIVEGRESSASNVKLKCGDCMFFAESRHPSKGSPCNKLGVQSFGTAPHCYTANIRVFRKVAPEAIAATAALVAAFSAQQQRVLMGLLKNAASLERCKLSFLEKVYFSVGNPDYLDNWFCGYALGLDPDKNVMVAGSDYLQKGTAVTTAYLMRSSLYTRAKFVDMKDKMLASGKLYEPRKPKKNHVVAIDYEPPTIETAQSWLDSAAAGKGKPQAKRMRASSNNPVPVKNSDGSVTFEVTSARGV
jgi:hypothetical protein